jgi:hypothetical protein
LQSRLTRILASICSRQFLSLIACLVISLPLNRYGCAEEAVFAAVPSPLAEIIIEFKAALQIPNDIDVQVVEKNDLLFSAAHHPQNRQAFRITCEKQFLDSLTESELRAAMAHEMGHIWIFTHHPYLQTEELADEIACKVVSKSDLNQVHSKTQTYLAKRSPQTVEAH